MTREMQSKIMKRAHENARSYTGSSYGNIGVAADFVGKQNTKATVTSSEVRKAEVTVKGWFLNKNYNQNERYTINTARFAVIEKETEKAVFVRFETDNGSIKGWFPKSVCTIAA